MPTDARGGCLCGEIRYQIRGEPLGLELCHCRTCRLASGAPVVAWAVVRREDFALERGEPVAFRSSPDVERTFCGRCGTSLTYRRDTAQSIDIQTATLDAADAYAPTREIWLEHKLAWMVNDPRLRQYPRDVQD